MFSVVVGLVKSKSSVVGDPLPIRLRVSYAGERVDFRLGVSVEAEKWSAEAQRALPGIRTKGGLTGASINKKIDSAITKITQTFARYDLEDGVPSPRVLRSEFNRFLGARSAPTKKSNDFFSYHERFVGEQSVLNSWSRSHKNRHVTVRNHLKAFSPSLRFSDIDRDFLLSFLNYLFTLELRNTTINKMLSYLRNFLKWAYHAGLYRGDQHITFTPKLKGSDGTFKTVVYLTWEELMAVYSLDIPPGKNYLERVRDIFCFLCFTGLRFSDVFNLSKVDIHRERIRVVTQKTVAPLYIELNKYSEALLEKYKGLPGDRAFPVISNQKMNDYLKELGRLAGLTEEVKMVYFIGAERFEYTIPKSEVLSTHCGRRTFIVLALRLGIPTVVIMKWTGHRSLQAMKPYIEIVDALKEEEMKKISSAGDRLSPK